MLKEKEPNDNSFCDTLWYHFVKLIIKILNLKNIKLNHWFCLISHGVLFFQGIINFKVHLILNQECKDQLT